MADADRRKISEAARSPALVPCGNRAAFVVPCTERSMFGEVEPPYLLCQTCAGDHPERRCLWSGPLRAN